MNSAQPDLFSPNLAHGQARLDQAMEQIERGYAGFLQAMREEARTIVRRVGEVTTDDLRALARIRGLGDPDPHVWGAVFKETDAAGRRVWRAIGRRASNITSNNARTVIIWILR